MGAVQPGRVRNALRGWRTARPHSAVKWCPKLCSQCPPQRHPMPCCLLWLPLHVELMVSKSSSLTSSEQDLDCSFSWHIKYSPENPWNVPLATFMSPWRMWLSLIPHGKAHKHSTQREPLHSIIQLRFAEFYWAILQSFTEKNKFKKVVESRNQTRQEVQAILSHGEWQTQHSKGSHMEKNRISSIVQGWEDHEFRKPNVI